MPIPIHELMDEHIEASGVPVAEVARRVGKTRAWLTKILHGERRIAADMIDEVLKAAEVDLHVFWSDYLQSLGSPRPLREVLDNQSPELLLRAIRQGRSARSETLEAVASLTFPVLSPEGQYEIDPRAEEIDSLRESNPVYARTEAEHWVRELHLQGLRKRLDASDAARMATSLGVWGSTLRVRGQVHLAAQVLELALKLHRDATSSATYADLLERSAFIFKGFGYLELSVGLIQRAIGIISLAGDEHRHSKAVLALGIVYLYLERKSLAEDAFLRVMRSPGSDLVRKAGAAVNLVALYENRGDFDKASSILGQIDPYRDVLPATWISQLQGLKAFILTHRGEHLEAADLLIESLRLAWQSLPADRTFVVFINLAIVLIRSGRYEELVSRASIQSELLTRLEDTPSSREIASAFIEMILSGQMLETTEVEAIRSRFMVAMKRDLSDSEEC